MKKINVIVCLILVLAWTFLSNMIVFADVDTIVVSSPQSDKYFQYELKDLLNSYRKYMRGGEKDLFYKEFLEYSDKNDIIFMHDDSGKYISYKDVCKAIHNKKVDGGIFDIDEYAKIAPSAKKPEYVYDRIIKDKKLVSRLNITGDNFRKELNDEKFKGLENFEDVIITGNNASILNGEIQGRLIIDPGVDGVAYVNNVQAKEIKVLSGGENSIHLFNVNSEKLEIESDSRVRVESKGTTYIKNTLVRTYAILDEVSGSYGEVIISINQEKTNDKIETVELRGVFTEPIVVESDVILKAGKDAVIPKVVIAPKKQDAEIKLTGNFRYIHIDKKAKVNLEKVSAYKIDVKSDAEVTMDENSKIKRLDKHGNKVEIKGKGKTNISKTYEKDVSDDNDKKPHKHSSDDDDDDDDDTDVSEIVKVKSVDIVEKKVSLNQGESKKLTAKVIYSDNTSDNKVSWQSSDESIATVKDGLVTAAADKKGTVTIKATVTKGGVTKTDECEVTVVEKNKIVEVIPNGNRVTFKINDKKVENKIITIRIFNKVTGSLEDVEQKQAENGYCEFEMKFDSGTYYAKINIVNLQEIETAQFTIK